VHHRIKGRQLACALLLVAGMALAVTACGSSSGQATKLLEQTFGGSHSVNSGDLSVVLDVDPSGSSTLKAPITVSFGGPFQRMGAGSLPASNFEIGISELGSSASVGLLSTGSTGYVTLQGASYQLPAASFQKLESTFAQITSSAAGGSGSGALSRLGIDPLRWLTDPSVIGTERVGGAETTHVRATVNVDALLGDINTFLQKAASAGIAGTAGISTISPVQRSRIANEVKNPRLDVWTGTGDKTLRKLAIKLSVPVSGRVSALLGGLRAAQIGLSLQYSNLGQHQTIQAPARVRPFHQFAVKLRSFLATVKSLSGGG